MQRGSAIASERIPPERQAEFDVTFRAERTAVERQLQYLTGDRALAEDLAQETFGRLYDRMAQSDAEPLRNPHSWLLTVASHLAYNHFRAESRRGVRESAAHAAASVPAGADPSARIDDMVDVRRVLGELGPRDRVVLLLRHSGLSYAEIAEAVGIAPTSVGTTLARAQSRFKDVYVGRGDAAGKE